MKSKGILFYVNFCAPVPLLPVALRTLSMNYDGDIHVLHSDSTPAWFVEQLEKCPRITNSYHDRSIKRVGKKRMRACALEKVYMFNSSPYDMTLFYDCDHVFLCKMDMTIFNEIEEHGLVNPVERPNEPICKQSRILKVAHELYGRDPDKQLGQSMGGCIGLIRGSSVHDEMIKVQEEVMAYPARNMFTEEQPMALVLEKYGKVLDQKWSWAYKQKKHCPRGDNGLKGMPEDLIGLHFAHKRYAVSRVWRDNFLKAKEDNVLGLADLWDEYLGCNTHVNDVVNMDEQKILS